MQPSILVELTVPRLSNSPSRVEKKLAVHGPWPYAWPIDPIDGRTPAPACIGIRRRLPCTDYADRNGPHVVLATDVAPTATFCRIQDRKGRQHVLGHRSADVIRRLKHIEFDGETEETGHGRHVGHVRDP